jgi:hypothetical protein
MAQLMLSLDAWCMGGTCLVCGMQQGLHCSALLLPKFVYGVLPAGLQHAANVQELHASAGPLNMLCYRHRIATT